MTLSELIEILMKWSGPGAISAIILGFLYFPLKRCMTKSTSEATTIDTLRHLVDDLLIDNKKQWRGIQELRRETDRYRTIIHKLLKVIRRLSGEINDLTGETPAIPELDEVDDLMYRQDE